MAPGSVNFTVRLIYLWAPSKEFLSVEWCIPFLEIYLEIQLTTTSRVSGVLQDEILVTAESCFKQRANV